MKPTINKPRKFSETDIKTKYFEHKYKDGGSVSGDFGVIRILDDGYATVVRFTPKGIERPSITAWSGCLYPTDRPIEADRQKLLEEARKLPTP